MRLRFTIRDLLWLAALAALAVGWWLDRRDAAAQRARDQEKISQLETELAPARAAADAHNWQRFQNSFDVPTLQ